MEIERKFLVTDLPEELEQYESNHIEQGYLATNPVVRIRKMDNQYYLTYKSSGMMERQEVELPLTQESYEHLKTKADGRIIIKRRYRIPYQQWTIELDCFLGELEGMVLAEVEFTSREEANAFPVPTWFKKDVTFEKQYHNSFLSQAKEIPIWE